MAYNGRVCVGQSVNLNYKLNQDNRHKMAGYLSVRVRVLAAM